MTASERSELAEIRHEMNLRFDGLQQEIRAIDNRTRAAEIAVGVAQALAERQSVEDERSLSLGISRRERLIGKTAIAVTAVIGLINLAIHFL